MAATTDTITTYHIPDALAQAFKDFDVAVDKDRVLELGSQIQRVFQDEQRLNAKRVTSQDAAAFDIAASSENEIRMKGLLDKLPTGTVLETGNAGADFTFTKNSDGTFHAVYQEDNAPVVSDIDTDRTARSLLSSMTKVPAVSLPNADPKLSMRLDAPTPPAPVKLERLKNADDGRAVAVGFLAFFDEKHHVQGINNYKQIDVNEFLAAKPGTYGQPDLSNASDALKDKIRDAFDQFREMISEPTSKDVTAGVIRERAIAAGMRGLEKNGASDIPLLPGVKPVTTAELDPDGSIRSGKSGGAVSPLTQDNTVSLFAGDHTNTSYYATGQLLAWKTDIDKALSPFGGLTVWNKDAGITTLNAGPQVNTALVQQQTAAAGAPAPA